MSSYNGYLVKVGNYAIPLSFIKAETYKVTHLIQDLDSYRDTNGVLHRTALPHVPNKCEFECVPMLTDTEMSAVMTSIRNEFTVYDERKANVQVYVPETDTYYTQEMYMPDPEFSMYYADGDKIIYNAVRFAFIGY